MDLKTFVCESITQIAQGIRAAQEANTGALICPRVITTPEGLIVDKEPTKWKEAPQLLSFDVAVTVMESDRGKFGGEMRVLGISIGGSSDNAHQNSTISRIKFDIPIVWGEISEE